LKQSIRVRVLGQEVRRWLVTAPTAPARVGVQAVVQLDREDAPTGVTTDAGGIATLDASLTPPVTITATVNGAAQCTTDL
jgi:hypothetical protein